MATKGRSWFRIHLSTACVCMLMAAVLVWTNIETGVVDGAFYNFGWPIKAHWLQGAGLRFQSYGMGQWSSWSAIKPIGAILCNVILAVYLTTVVGILCELLIRSRDRKQQKPPA